MGLFDPESREEQAHLTIAYDIPNAISIESDNDFIGKTVKFYG